MKGANSFIVFVMLLFVGCRVTETLPCEDYILKLPKDLQFRYHKIPDAENGFLIIEEAEQRIKQPNDELWSTLRQVAQPYSGFPDTDKELLKLLNNNQQELEQFNKLAGYSQIQYPKILNGGATKLDYLNTLRFLTRLKIVHIKYLYSKKHYKKAGQEIMVLQDILGRLDKKTLSLIGYLVLLDVSNNLYKTIQWYAMQPESDTTTLTKILAKLPDKQPVDHALINAVKIEFNYVHLPTLLKMNNAKSKAEIKQLLKGFYEFDDREEITDRVLDIFLNHNRLFDFSESMIVAHKVFEKLIKNAESSWDEQDHRLCLNFDIKSFPQIVKQRFYPIIKANDSKKLNTILSPENIAEFQAFPNPLGRKLAYRYNQLKQLNEYSFSSRELCEATKAILAIQIYRKLHNCYPDSLDELVEKSILKTSPVDMYNYPEPMNYSSTKKCIWSIGDNEIDDNGVANELPYGKNKDVVYDLAANSDSSISRLAYAICEKDMNFLKRHLKKKHFKQFNIDGNPLIHTALLVDDKEIIKFLLSQGADINIYNKKGKTPLHRAIFDKNAERVNYLCENGANVEKAYLLKISPTSTLSISPIILASRNNEIMKILLKHGANINTISEDGSNALLFACNGSLENIKFLIKNGCKTDGSKIKQHAIIYATKLNKINMVKFLLESGANVNASDDVGRSALIVACAQESGAEIIKLLLQNNADVNTKLLKSKAIGTTPLILAASKHSPATLKLLLDNGADLNACSNFGNALHAALYGKKVDNALFLIDRGININHLSKSGAAPLHLTTRNDNKLLLQKLLNKGVDVNKRNSKGSTALILAAATGNNDFIDLLLKNGADINAKNDKGGTAVITAAALKHFDTAEKLLDAGALATGVTENGSNLLLTAVAGKNYKLVKRLINNKNDLNYKVNNPNSKLHNVSPLSMAVSSDAQAIAELLLNAGADPNITTSKGVPLVFLAIQNKNLEILKCLHKKGAKLDSKVNDSESDLFRHTPMSLARQIDATKIVDYLKKNNAAQILSDSQKLDIAGVKSDIPYFGKTTIIANPASGFIMNKNNREVYALQWNYDKDNTGSIIDDEEFISEIINLMFLKGLKTYPDSEPELESKNKGKVDGHDAVSYAYKFVNNSKPIYLYLTIWDCDESKRTFCQCSASPRKQQNQDFTRWTDSVQCHSEKLDYASFQLIPQPQLNKNWEVEEIEFGNVYSHKEKDISILLSNGFSLPVKNNNKMLTIFYKLILDMMCQEVGAEIEEKVSSDQFRVGKINANRTIYRANNKSEEERLKNLLNILEPGSSPPNDNSPLFASSVNWQLPENKMSYFAFILTPDKDLLQEAYDLLKTIEYKSK